MGEHLLCKQRVAGSNPVISTMDDLNVALALKNYCEEQFKPLHIWGDEIDDNWDNNFSSNFRLVFKVTKGTHPNCALRSEIYIDIALDGTIVSLGNERRESLTVDLMTPDSLDKIDEFVSKRSTEKIALRIRSIRDLQLTHGKRETSGRVGGIDSLAEIEDLATSPVGETTDNGRVQQQKHRRNFIWEI